MEKKEDTYSYRGWLNSDNFWKRVVGIWGYMMVGQLVLMAITFLIAFVVGLAAALILS